MAHCYSVAPISILSRLDDPNVFYIFLVLFALLKAIVVLQEFLVLRVFSALADVKSQRNDRLRALFFALQVSFDVVEKCFFVANIKVELHVIVQTQLS